MCCTKGIYGYKFIKRNLSLKKEQFQHKLSSSSNARAGRNVSVIISQTGATISCPLHSADFLDNIEQIMSNKFHAKTEQECRDPDCKYIAAFISV